MTVYRRYLSVVTMMCLTALLAGCSVLPKPPPAQATYDLGPPPPSQLATVPLSTRITLSHVGTPGWMNNTDMFYRLAYADDSRIRAYSLSRWVAPPASLVEQRLQALYHVVQPHGHSGHQPLEVKLQLQRFDQIFAAPKIAHVVMALRLSVYDDNGALLAERTFSGREPCVTPNAQGGVHALSELSTRVVRHALVWLHARGWKDGHQHKQKVQW